MRRKERHLYYKHLKLPLKFIRNSSLRLCGIGVLGARAEDCARRTSALHLMRCENTAPESPPTLGVTAGHLCTATLLGDKEKGNTASNPPF